MKQLMAQVVLIPDPRTRASANVSLAWHTDSAVFGDDGCADIDMLIEPGFTRPPNVADLRSGVRGERQQPRDRDI
ncbi:hypothetical protein CBI38_28475 [Rhodococcus oxybenzonivorans]|uniref:Uncharacterized protein n=1 Tax=Rhodococcus oxybenzonivorans TaxID=1990687 RepID=A0A2S2C202_9NOCA|nr:hypothetical protein CBI38_28475 [Rhodococcus oxybenzonivorans]